MTQWQTTTLGEVITFQRGFDLPHRARRPGNVPIVSSAGVTGHHNASMVDPPGVVTGRYGTIGELFFVTEPFWPLNTTLYVRDFRGNDPRFIYYHLQRFDFDTFSGKSGVPGVNRNELHAEIVTLPIDVAEQRVIAGALSDVDALLNWQERLIAKKRDLREAAIQQLLSGRTRLPGFNREWKRRPLRQLVQAFIVPMRDKPGRWAGDIPWCRIEDFDGIYLTESKSGQTVDVEIVREMNLKVYPQGTLLVSCSADLGRCAIVGRPLVSNQTFIGLVMDETASSNLFFYYLMASRASELNQLSSGTTISYLSREHFERFEVLAPSDVNEQKAIAAVLSDIDAELAVLEARRHKTRALKQGMMQELLTGRTRLIGPAKASGTDASHA